MTEDFDPAKGLPISPPRPTIRPCPKCDGRGYLQEPGQWLRLDCPLCHGTKVVPLEA